VSGRSGDENVAWLIQHRAKQYLNLIEIPGYDDITWLNEPNNITSGTGLTPGHKLFLKNITKKFGILKILIIFVVLFILILLQMKLVFKDLASAKRDAGFSYLGMINNGSKHEKAYKFGELVYTIYLAPGNMSGYEVCAGRTIECTKLCLNESGHNRMDAKNNFINRSRIGKTKMFFENHEFFTRWVIRDINAGITRAKKQGLKFSVRINNTSDISPELLWIKVDGVKQNILQLFPDIQFYDYTKVQGRLRLMNKYPNYDLTYSYNGQNMETCLQLLRAGIKVAMVFEKVPTEYNGFKVVDGDLYDMRYKDEPGSIIGLKLKKVRSKPDMLNTFVIREHELALEPA